MANNTISTDNQLGFNINRFRANIAKNGVMRTNKFLVRIPWPIGFRQHARLAKTATHLEFWCESTNIPGISVATTEIRRYGYGNMEKKPYGVTNNDINFSFISDGNAAIWTFFQQWIRMIVNYDARNGINADKSNGVLPGQKPFELAYKYEYVSDVEIVVFDDAGEISLIVVLREAYPTFVGDIQLNWGDTNSVARVPVTMSVYDWYNKAKYDIETYDADTSNNPRFNHRDERRHNKDVVSGVKGLYGEVVDYFYPTKEDTNTPQ